MKPYAEGETGGIKGHVIYSSTRPFDNPALLLQLSWEPGVPRVQLNLYKEGTAADGSTSLTLVDTHHDHQLGRLGAGFPSRHDGCAHAQHELPGPGSEQPVLRDACRAARSG